MSRKQWGHGYYVGLNANAKSEGEYLVEYDKEGYCDRIFIIHEKHGDTYVLEALDYFDIALYFGLAGPSLKKEDIVPENIIECKLSDLGETKKFYSWASCFGEFKKANKHWDLKFMKKEAL